jgi:hypothetical protein
MKGLDKAHNCSAKLFGSVKIDESVERPESEIRMRMNGSRLLAKTNNERKNNTMQRIDRPAGLLALRGFLYTSTILAMEYNLEMGVPTYKLHHVYQRQR